ncbi:MAG: LysR family transcriptional regulator [Elainellaceae cyanobacterium]
MARRSRDGLTLSQLRALIAVAEHHNFGKASLELDMSQSAVSHAIATLEDELGVILLSRGRYGARLTPVGERIVEQAQKILQSLEVIEKEASFAKGLQGGQVRIAAFRSLATHILPKVIAAFRSNFPGISVSIREYRTQGEVERALRHGEADVGLFHLPGTTELETWELFDDEYFVFLPPNAPIHGKTLTWEDLAQYPLILSPGNDSCSVLIRSHFAKHDQALNIAYEVSEDSTMLSMVQQGLGAAILPRMAAEPIPADLQIYPLPVPLSRTNGVAVLADAMHLPAVFAFLDTLKSMPDIAIANSTSVSFHSVGIT